MAVAVMTKLPWLSSPDQSRTDTQSHLSRSLNESLSATYGCGRDVSQKPFQSVRSQPMPAEDLVRTSILKSPRQRLPWLAQPHTFAQPPFGKVFKGNDIQSRNKSPGSGLGEVSGHVSSSSSASSSSAPDSTLGVKTMGKTGCVMTHAESIYSKEEIKSVAAETDNEFAVLATGTSFFDDAPVTPKAQLRRPTNLVISTTSSQLNPTQDPVPGQVKRLASTAEPARNIVILPKDEITSVRKNSASFGKSSTRFNDGCARNSPIGTRGSEKQGYLYTNNQASRVTSPPLQDDSPSDSSSDTDSSRNESAVAPFSISGKETPVMDQKKLIGVKRARFEESWKEKSSHKLVEATEALGKQEIVFKKGVKEAGAAQRFVSIDWAHTKQGIPRKKVAAGEHRDVSSATVSQMNPGDKTSMNFANLGDKTLEAALKQKDGSPATNHELVQSQAGNTKPEVGVLQIVEPVATNESSSPKNSEFPGARRGSSSIPPSEGLESNRTESDSSPAIQRVERKPYSGKARRKPVARNWRTLRKRITAAVACVNSALLGYIFGLYAGEVPRIQYQLGDERHHTIYGNVVLYAGIALSTFFCWPLPLLHGRKPYILAGLAVILPLQFPQALSLNDSSYVQSPKTFLGILLPRAISGLALGLVNINSITVLLDLFGASLQSKNPHQEAVATYDPRRHGGGMGIWLGIWSCCFLGSLALGFLIGACIISNLDPAWGFYIVMIVTAMVLLLNVLAPETRRSTYRQSIARLVDANDNIYQIVARGEVKLHLDADPPSDWTDELKAGVKLSLKMLSQPGFAVLAVYLGWIYAQVVLLIVLLGALLSRNYRFRPQYIGLGVFSITIGALCAVPLSKASLFSRARSQRARTDSMTIKAKVSWTSHLVRRIIFTVSLPFAGLAYTLLSPGTRISFALPCLLVGIIGFLSSLALSECYGLIMETFDTSDLQPGVNSRHRLQSMASVTRRRRTDYSSFPRVTAGIFVSQTLAFCFAAIATAIGGLLIRGLGAQAATGVFAGVILLLTILLTAVLLRFKEVQVIPNNAFGERKQSLASVHTLDEHWRPVIIGNPTGKKRRMNILEMGSLSRWTEVRRLNKLVKD